MQRNEARDPADASASRSRIPMLALLLLALTGCAGGTVGIGGGRSYQNIGEGDKVVRPGMTSAEVIQMLGNPYYRFGVRQDNATIWNYRMRYGSCEIYQVSILPSGVVKDAGTAPDPACDVPDRRRW